MPAPATVRPPAKKGGFVKKTANKVTKYIWQGNKWVEVDKFPQEAQALASSSQAEGPGGGEPPGGGHPAGEQEADEQGNGKDGVEGQSQWLGRMRALLSGSANVADLFALFTEFDEHNRQVRNNYMFAQHVAEMCNAFSERFPTNTYPAGEVGTPFLWHLLVKLLQYLNYLPPDERSDVRKTMNDVWIFLGQSSLADLQLLRETPPALLRHDGLLRTSFFPGPLQDISTGQTMWERWFLSWSAKRVAVEHALTVYVVCHIVGKNLHDNGAWHFSWRTCLDAFQQSLGDRVPDCLQEVLKNKQEVLSAVTDPQDTAHLARALSPRWPPQDVIWCAKTVMRGSVSTEFLDFYVQHASPALHHLYVWKEFLQEAEPHLAPTTMSQLLVGIGVTHCKGSLPILLNSLVIPCNLGLATHRHLLDQVAQQLHLHEKVWEEFVEMRGNEGWAWLLWLFKLFCRQVASGAFNGKAQAQRLQASVKMVQQMSAAFELVVQAHAKLASCSPSVSLEEFSLAELDMTITVLRNWVVDPAPALLAFLSHAGHCSDNHAEKVTKRVLDAQRASVKDSTSWYYLCNEGVNAFRAPAAATRTPTPQWVLRLAGMLAAGYADIAIRQPHGHVDGFIKELPGQLLNAMMQCNKVVKTVFGVVCLRKLSPTLAAVTEAVLDSCYDISTIWSNLPNAPTVLQVLDATVGPLEDVVTIDAIDVWKQFKQTITMVLMMDCQSIPRIQLEALKQSQASWFGIATALGHRSVPAELWETAAFDKELEDVQKAVDIAEWLARFNVEGAANQAGCLAAAPTATLTIEKLASKRKQLESFLHPIAEHLELIAHCRKTVSVIFDIAIKMLFQDAETDVIDMMTVRVRICKCNRQLGALLSLEMQLDDAKNFFLQKQVNIRQEVEKLVALPRYHQYAAGAQESIELALKMLQYSTETEEVAQLIDQYTLLQDPANDAGLQQLKVSQRGYGSSFLKDAPMKFNHLKELFSAQGESLSGVHFQLFRKLRKCPEVIAFLREFVTQKGRQNFENARQRLTVQLQAQDLETKLLNDVIEVRELILPFVIKHRSFAHFIAAVVGARLGSMGLVARLDLIQANIGRVKLWFQSALSTKVESAAVQAALVNDTGRMEIVLGRLFKQPTKVNVRVEVEGQQINMNEGEIRELSQQLALSVRPVRKHAVELAAAEDGVRERTSATCKRCLDKLYAAMRLYDLACALESHGHPQHQARTFSINLSDQQSRDSLQVIAAEAEEYEKKLEDWRVILQEEKRACPFLAAFDARELLLMHILLDADVAKSREITQMMSGQVVQTLADGPEASARANEEVKELAAQSLTSFLQSARGLTQHREVQELDAPMDARAHGSERLSFRQGLQRLARLFERNPRQNPDIAPEGEAQGDDPRTCLRRLARFLERNLQAVHAPRHGSSQGGDDRFQMVANVKCGDEFAPLLSLLQHAFRNERAIWSTRCILWCDGTVSQDGANAFMQRIEAFPTHSFVVLGVNRLPPQIQQLVCDFQKRQSEKGPRQGRIIYAYLDAEAAPAADFLAPYPPVPERSLAELRGLFRPMRHEWAGRVKVLCGLPGCGKSTRARASLAGRQPDSVAPTVAFLDELDLRRIHEGLASLNQTQEAAGTVVGIDISDRADWMAVNRALFDLFVFGVWRNLEDGTLYATRSSQNYLVEVPFCGEEQGQMTVQENLEKCFPALVACADAAVEELTETSQPFEVDERTRFIAKFWKAFRTRDAQGRVPLNRLCLNDAPVTHPDLASDTACREELLHLIQGMRGLRKRQQQCLQRFLHRRFRFFESPLYQYNCGAVPVAGRARGRGLNDLGTRIMKQMVREARMLCEPGFVCSARDAPCSILVYDQAFALKPCWAENDREAQDLMPLVEEGHAELQALPREHERCCALLRWRLQLLDGEVERLSGEFGFVLVKDFAFKLLCIYERKEAGIPVIIEGVTGVGKTFVLKFLAHLLNHRLVKKDSDVEEAPRVVWRFKMWLRSQLLPRVTNREQASAWQKQVMEEDCTVDSMVDLWQQILEEPLPQHRQGEHATASAAAPADPAVQQEEELEEVGPMAAGAAASAASAAGRHERGAHLLLREQVILWLEQLPLVKPDATLSSLLEEVLDQPEMSSDLLRAFLNVELHEVFYRLLLHPDMSSVVIEAFVQDIADKAVRAPAATFVVLFDELNTSSALGLLKAVVVDHKLNGSPLPSNIFFVGCINPHKHVERNTRGAQEYMVHALPASMAELRWQYPPLQGADLEDFVTEKIRRSPTKAAGQLSNVMTAAFAKMICVCQGVFSEILGESSVNQRDVQRCLVIFSFFWDLRLPSKVQYDEAPNDKLVRCMVLSLAIVYYFRIADDETYGGCRGSDLRKHLDLQLRKQVPLVRLCFREEVDTAVDKVISPETFNIPEGVALNRDLRENLFACLVCVETKVPVCLLGPPGRSKTLAFEVLTQNLLGERSTTEFCRNFHAVDPIVYQCSHGSTGQEISGVLNRAAERETGYMADGGRTGCVVFLDEGGLPPDHRMALKVLHDPLDECKLPIIVASNRPLDAANQGRMLTVARQAQTQDDYELMGRELLAPAVSPVPLPLRCLVKGLARAFLEVRPSFQQSFTDRDFVSLLRHLRAEAAEGRQSCPTPAALLRGLENNFFKPGIDVQVVAQLFFAELNGEFEQNGLGEFPLPAGSYRKPLEIMEDCIRGGQGSSGARGASLRSRHPHLAPRFCMILDGGEDDAVVRLLLQEGLLPHSLEVLHVPTVATHGEDDLDLLAVNQMARLQHCMESGQPVLLRNASRILTPFYNLFNQNYRVTQTDEGEQLLYIIVAHGARTHFCRVHPDFFVVLHMPLSEYATQPEPLKSRFAQVQVTVDEVRELRLEAKLAQELRRDLVQRAFDRCHSFVEHAVKEVGASCFTGLQPRQTVESLCLLHLDCFVDALAGRALPSKISPLCDLSGAGVELAEAGLDGAVQTVLLHLLQIARPECLLQVLGTLGNEKLYRWAYFHCQNHFSLPGLVRSALSSYEEGGGRKLPKLVVQTRTSSEVLWLLKLQSRGGGVTAPGAQNSGKELWAEIGLAPADVHVLDFDEVDSAAYLEDRIAVGADKRLVLLGVDMRGRSNANVTWLRDVIDRFAADLPDVLFVLLLHFPPEVVLSGKGTCPCTFLDHWEFFFLDSLGFRTPFREDLLVQVLCAGEALQDLPPLIRHDISLEAVTMDFARRALLPLGARPPRVADDAQPHVHAAARFYEAGAASTEERAAALRKVLHQKPAIWQQLVAAFHESCQAGDVRDELITLAAQIRRGEQLMSFMDAALFRLRHRFDSVALAFLAQLCSNEGLVGLAQDATGATASLLRLMPMPKCIEVASNVRIPIHSQQSREGLSPLLCLLHHQLLQHLRKLGLVSCVQTKPFGTQAHVLDALRTRIEQDPSLRQFCTHAEAAVLQDYARFLVQLTCGRSLSQGLSRLLLKWTAAGAVGEEVQAPAALAQLVAVTGLQGGRLGSLARLAQLLESKFDGLGVLDMRRAKAVGSGERAEAHGHFTDFAQDVELWRLEVESEASVAVEEAAWRALLRCGAPGEAAAGDCLTPWEWVGLVHRTEHALRMANEWCKTSSSNGTISKRRLMMRTFIAVLPGLENARKIVLARSLCARVEAFEGTEEAPVWMIRQLVDLLQHETLLLRQALAMLLYGLLDEKSIWSKEAWVNELFTLIEKKVVPAVGAADDQGDFLVAEELALLVIREIRSHMLANGGQEQGRNRQAQRHILDNWPLLRRFLESQGMSGCYLPSYSQERRAAGAVPMPRVADLLFQVHCHDLIACDKPSVEVLQTCFFNAQRFAASTAPDKSILAHAHAYAFTMMLGRWLCDVETPQAINEGMLAPVHEMLQEAGASILPLHAVPLALEIQNCGGGTFLQGLLQNESVARAMPQLRGLLLGTGLCVVNADAADLAEPVRARSPPLPLSLTAAHGSSPLGDLRPQYQQICEGLAAALQQADPQALRTALREVAAEPLSGGHAKGLFLLAIYYEYYSERQNPAVLLAPVLGWLQDLLPGAPEEELRFFRCFIAPATHQLGYSPHGAASNDLNATFALDCRDPLQVAIRHCLVNILALSLFVPAARRDHFWMHATTPGALRGRLGFGSSLATPVGSTHYDCGCVFGLDGFFRHSQRCQHWPLQAATASYIHCFGGFCLNYLVNPRMHHALHGRVLTPNCIRAGGAERFLDMAGDRAQDATVQFCYQRVCTSVLYLQGSLGLHPEEQCMLLSLVCELGVSKLLEGTSHLKFQYDTADEKRAAEKEFRDAFLDTVDRRAEIFEALRQNGAEAWKRLCPPSWNATGGNFEAALTRAPSTPTVQVLQTFSSTRSDLELVSLVPPLLRFYWFIHEELNQHIQGSLTIQAAAETALLAAVEDFVRGASRTPEQRQRSRELCKEGVDAFNALSEKLDGMLVIECGRDEIPIEKISPETSLMLVLSSHQAPSSENVLYRALEYLLKLRQDFLDAVERAAADPDASGALQRVPGLLGDVPLAHLIHMPLALAEECRLTVPDFVQRAEAIQQCNRDIDVELLLPTLLRASVVGKSRWTLSEVQRDFCLVSETVAIGDEAVTKEGDDCLPPYFNTTPVGDARADIEACLQSLRQSELLELFGLLSRASSFMQRWREAEGSCQFSSRLRDAGFELPGHCQEELQTPHVCIKHTGFILQQSRERLHSRAFTFVHLPSRLRRQLPAGAAAKLDHLFEGICQDVTAVDDIIAYFSAHEESFLQQEARPLVATIEETAPEVPTHLQEVLSGFPREVLCRHLFETLLRLLALRLRLAENSASRDGDAQQVARWWESMSAVPDLSDDAHAEAAAAADASDDEEGWELVCDALDLPERVVAMLRRCLQQRYQHLHCQPAGPSARMVEEEEVEEAEAPGNNFFKIPQMEELAMKRKWAESVLLRFLRRWLRRNRWQVVHCSEEEWRGSSHVAGVAMQQGGSAVLREAALGGITPIADKVHGHRVELQRSTIPAELLRAREGLPPSVGMTQDPSTRQPWTVWVGDTKLPQYRMIGSKVFGKVCEQYKLSPESTAVVSTDGLCEDDPQAPTHDTLRFVPKEELVECEAEGQELRFHCSADAETLAACVLRKNPGMDSCFVTNSSLQLQPLSCQLSEVEQPVHVMDDRTHECWRVTTAEGTGYLASIASVACLTRYGLNAIGLNTPLRVWSPSLGALDESDELQVLADGDESVHVSLIPAAEITRLNIDAFGANLSVEVPVSATALEVIHLLLSARDSAATFGTTTTPAQLVLLAGGKDLQPEDLVVAGDGQHDELRLSMVAIVEHFARNSGHSSIRLVTGMTAKSLMAQLDYPQQVCCLVGTDYQIIEANTELWKAPHKFSYLSVCTPLVVSVQTLLGEVRELRLGCKAGLPSIHRAAQDAGLLPENASLLWTCGGSSCWPVETAASPASLLDFQDELTEQHRPTFVVKEGRDLIHLQVGITKHEGHEEQLMGVVASKDSQLRGLQAQLATFTHLPGRQLVLHGGVGEVLDDEEKLDEVFGPEEEGEELAMLKLCRPHGDSRRYFNLAVCSTLGDVCEFHLDSEEDAVCLWRLVRWNFGVAPLDFSSVFTFSNDVGVFSFAEDEKCSVKELREAFEEQACEEATVRCTDICGREYIFTLEWRA